MCLDTGRLPDESWARVRETPDTDVPRQSVSVDDIDAHMRPRSFGTPSFSSKKVENSLDHFRELVGLTLSRLIYPARDKARRQRGRFM